MLAAAFWLSSALPANQVRQVVRPEPSRFAGRRKPRGQFVKQSLKPLWRYGVQAGYTCLACMTQAKGRQWLKRHWYTYEVEGRNYHYCARDCLTGPESLILFDEGE